MRKSKIEKMFKPIDTKEKKVYKYKGYGFPNLLSYFIGIIVYWFAVLIYKAESIYYNNIKWSEKRTIKILNDIIPRCFFKDMEIKKFYSYIIPQTKRWENQAKRIHRNYCMKYNKEISNYLLNDYELEGFTKVTIFYPNEFNWDEYKINFILKRD